MMEHVAERVMPSATVEVRPPSPPGLARLLFSGSSALGLSTVLERGLVFLANLAAARLGGAPVFGAYAVAMTTANNVASYAGAGIGTTANRFSGEYPYGGPGYGGFVRALALVCLSSAALAGAILWFAAQPLATHLLRNAGLAGLLRLAALSAGAVILLECLRGLLIGQRRYAGLLALSALFGGTLLIVLPTAAGHGPSSMVLGQAATATGAILICVLLARKLRFAPQPPSAGRTRGPRPGVIMRFGLVQLAAVIGINAAGWWTASMVARADISLAQSAWYSVAMQLRNMCAMPGWLISQTAYAQLTEKSGQQYGGAGRVTLLSTIVATLVSLLAAGPAAALMPWLVFHLYGRSFAGAEFAATLAVATGLIHMSAAPAAARLTVVSLRLTGVINAAWSVLLVGLGSWLVPKGGAAAGAACFLAAHLFSTAAVLAALLYLRSVPRELIGISLPALTGSVAIAGLGWLRAAGPHKTALSAAMLAVTAGLAAITFHHGRKTSAALRELTISRLASNLRAGGGLPPGVRTFFAGH
jgi:O-antigen/teichoic acid export membrane protein